MCEALLATYLDGLIEDLEGEELGVVVLAHLEDFVGDHIGVLIRLELVKDTVCVLHLHNRSQDRRRR